MGEFGGVHFQGPVTIGGDFVNGDKTEVWRGSHAQPSAEVVGDFTGEDPLEDDGIVDAEVVESKEVRGASRTQLPIVARAAIEAPYED